MSFFCKTRTDTLRNEMRSGFGRVERRLGNLETRVESLETEVQTVKTENTNSAKGLA